MKKGIQGVSTLVIAGALTLSMGVAGASANEPGYGHGEGKDGYGGRGHGMMGSHGMGMMHSSTGHLIRHLLKHEKEIGLTADQVAKLKDIQLSLDKTRIKSEADIQVAERELKALTDDEKSDLKAIESKLKQSEDMQVALRMTSIKTRRDVLALLTQEQRAKEKAEHEKMMQQHKEGGRAHGTMPGGMNPHGGGMQGNPHMGGGAAPMPPSDMKAQ
jgi:Spy/CpxP family protein refolding chaperone